VNQRQIFDPPRLCFNRAWGKVGSRYEMHLKNTEVENFRVVVRDGRFFSSRNDRPPFASPIPVLQMAANAPLKRALKPRHVLVVEDNLDSVHSLVFLLRDMGHHVDYAINGYAALEIAGRTRPEFVFLDLGLPGMDGFHVCKRMKSDPALTATRIIAITGYAGEDYRVRSKAVGCELHLVKPVTPQILEKILI
jgi:CheY-like chemotaxis protein